MLLGRTRAAALALSRRLHASAWFGLAMIALVWTGIAIKSIDDFVSRRAEAQTVQENFALVFEENVLRSIGEIDKALLYLRRMIENRIGRDDLHQIVSTTDVLSEIIVQVAVIDAKGIMRASNVGPQPAKPIDLSDREHYRVHVGSDTDRLFISKPVLGRASNKWSVQITRRFLMPDGSFGGVVVGSLNPEHFTKFFEQVQFGSTVAISLIGTDGVVRSSGGHGSGTLALGESVAGTPLATAPGARRVVTFEAPVRGDERIVSLRSVRGFPLTVAVSSSTEEIYEKAWLSLARLAIVGLVLTAAIAFAIRYTMLAADRRSAAEEAVRRLASEDALTGLANRRTLQAALDHCAGRDTGARWGLICLDLDRFKTVNDTLGHRVGDLLLQSVAERIRSILPASATAARLGGDEFAILLPDLQNDAVLADIAAALLSSAVRPHDLDGQSVVCSFSVGIATAPDHGPTGDELLVSADLALYAAKRAGRNRVVTFDASMNDDMLRRREVEVDLRRALDAGDEIAPHFQPIYAADGVRLIGFEALARWRHPVKGNVPPDQFIGIAEEYGLIVPLGEAIVGAACRVAATWPEPLSIAVNLSPAQFANSDVPEFIERCLAQSGLAARRLEIEITESLLLSHDARTLDALERLRTLGVRIAMDDFGTGFSSLAYLNKFPLDKIKIDRSFIKDVTVNPRSEQIVDAIVRIAHAHGMVTTAEGVETVRQREALAALGCDQVQGFLLGRAVPADACRAFLPAEQVAADPAEAAA